jgi:tetratricopeptide (TPR) repeat protein
MISNSFVNMMKKWMILAAVALMVSGCGEKNAQYYVKSGISKASRKNYNGAMHSFSKALEKDSALVDAYVARAFYVKEMTGDYQGAIDDYSKAIDLRSDDNDFNAYSNRGHARFMMKDSKGAITDLQKALELNVLAPMTYRNRALLFLQIRNFPMACLDMKKALELGLEDPYRTDIQQLFEQYCLDDGSVK